MSLEAHAIGRTAKILSPYKVTQRTGKNGAFESKMVMWSLATDRDYKQSVQKEDGSIAQEYATDFIACKATGPVADLFSKYCSATKVDENGNEKLVSRRLYVSGHIEKYKATRDETIQFEDGGVLKQIQVSLPEEREILVVEKIKFLDANPIQQQNQTATTATATVVSATPVAQAQAQQVVQTVPAAPIAAPVSEEQAPF